MASAAYYWRKAAEASKRAQQFAHRRDALKAIRTELDRSPTVRDINKTIDDLSKEMFSALRGSPRFSANAYAIQDHKIGTVDNSVRLITADNALSSEINSMDRKRKDAEEDASYYRKKAREAAKAEKAAAQQGS